MHQQGVAISMAPDTCDRSAELVKDFEITQYAICTNETTTKFAMFKSHRCNSSVDFKGTPVFQFSTDVAWFASLFLYTHAIQYTSNRTHSSIFALGLNCNQVY